MSNFEILEKALKTTQDEIQELHTKLKLLYNTEAELLQAMNEIQGETYAA